MFTVKGGRIYDGAQEIQLRGLSHYGFNDSILIPQYLWQMGWKEQIQQIKDIGFNAIRVPFVPNTLYDSVAAKNSYIDPNKNADLLGKTPLQILDLWLAEVDRQGLYFMLDFHSTNNKSQVQAWHTEDASVMYNQQPYTRDNWIRDLVFVAKRYANLSRFLAIDIFNEPHDIVRWDVGDANAPNPLNFWKPAAEAASAAILAANPNLLIFVQGITANWDGKEKANIPINWGENFQPQAYLPFNIPADKLVLSPHTYGPDVYPKSSFTAQNYPANLAADWETLFGQFFPKYAVVPGEWGGRYGKGGTGQPDVIWQNAFVDYMISKGMTSSFYWCYTPNSGDTGGILDDTLVVREDKMLLLRKLWNAKPVAPPLPIPTPTWKQADLYAVVDTITGTSYQLLPTGERVASLDVAQKYVDKYRIGKETRTAILKFAAMIKTTK